jgi:predicted Fe-Mo cluster-binding NifX family protein
MRLIFPTDENMGYLSKRGAHFGKAKYYTIVTLENGKITNIDGIENDGHKAGSCGNAVSNIMNLNPDALIISGIGNKPAKGFSEVGLNVYIDKVSDTVEESIKLFTSNQLEKIGNKGTCSTH